MSGFTQKTLPKEPLDLFAGYSYSEEDSLSSYGMFLLQNNYAEETYEGKIRGAKRVHKRFPSLAWLNHYIAQYGVRKAFDIQELSYIHFLCMIGLIDITATDFFFATCKGYGKLIMWYKPYYDELGISALINAVSDIIERTNLNKKNEEKIKAKTERLGIYLVMKYHLSNVFNLTEAQWRETLEDVDQASVKISNIFPWTIISQAFFEAGVMSEDVLRSFRKRTEHTRSYDDLQEVKPIVSKYLAFIGNKYEKGTIKAHKKALDTFFIFAKKRRGFKSLEDITRKLIYDYRKHVLSQGFSSSYNEEKLYCLKQFLVFVETNAEELSSQGYKIPKSKVVVKKDFKVKAHKRLPRPIDKEVLELMLAELGRCEDEVFRLAFLLMLTTGVALADLLILKQDCLETRADGSHALRIYRKKKKKYYEVKPQPVAVEIINCLKRRNTQVRPMRHPDGSEAIFLINDGGHTLTRVWFVWQFEAIKAKLAEENPALSEKIMSATPHMLRHTFATRARDNGADIYTLSFLLGHESIVTTGKYVRESDRIKEEYIERLNQAYVFEATDDISQLTSTAKGLAIISDMLKYENDMGIGKCTINGRKNCPRAYKCIDCMYLCSTREDVPEMLAMIESLKAEYNNLVNQGRATEAEDCRRRILRLKAKIKKLYEG